MFPAVKLVLVTVTRLCKCHVTRVTRDTGLVTRHILPDLHDVGIHDRQPTLAALHDAVVSSVVVVAADIDC